MKHDILLNSYHNYDIVPSVRKEMAMVLATILVTGMWSNLKVEKWV